MTAESRALAEAQRALDRAYVLRPVWLPSWWIVDWLRGRTR
jgi:hypothetical protein